MTYFRTTSRGAAAALALLLLPSLGGRVLAADFTIGTLHISQPWARATPKGAAEGAGYMTVTNTGSAPERLSCGSSDVSARCQIHEMSMTNGVMKMREVPGGLEVKPGETVTFKPGGFHVMFVDIKHQLQPGQMVMATLKTGSGATAEVDFPILAIGAAAPGAAAPGGQMMMSPGSGMMQMHKP